MKKMLIVLGLGLMASGVWASCMGPFCWDDQGAYIAGSLMDGNGDGMPSMTVAQANAACPRAKGQEIYCSNCAANGNAGTICVSTATTCNNASNFDYVLSSGTLCK